MVIYDLVCANFHTFEGWFKDNEDFKAQQAAGLICCPACDNSEVKLKPSKLAIAGKKSNQISSQQPEKIKEADSSGDKQEQSAAMHFNSSEEQMSVLREIVEKNFEDVGDQFSDEVRKMHYGEKDHRGIRGNATNEEIEDLAEEGIDTYVLPVTDMNKKKLN